MNLSYMADFLKGSNGIPHDRDFLGLVKYLLDSNGLCVSSIDYTFIVLDWNEDTLIVKDRPILFDKHVDAIAYGRFQM
jgi:hypothetical protein